MKKTTQEAKHTPKKRTEYELDFPTIVTLSDDDKDRIEWRSPLGVEETKELYRSAPDMARKIEQQEAVIKELVKAARGVMGKYEVGSGCFSVPSWIKLDSMIVAILKAGEVR